MLKSPASYNNMNNAIDTNVVIYWDRQRLGHHLGPPLEVSSQKRRLEPKCDPQKEPKRSRTESGAKTGSAEEGIKNRSGDKDAKPSAQSQNEKQYYCLYCPRSFKYPKYRQKHQDSPHLSRWSCAALKGDSRRAFHTRGFSPPNFSSNPGNPPPPYTKYDVCGYCGMRFPHEHIRDWCAREQHMSTVHKFGECKEWQFERRAAFQKHVRVIHSGQIGEWRKILEEKCLKEQPHSPLRSSISMLNRDREDLAVEVFGHTVTSQSTSKEPITICVKSDRVDNASAARDKHDEDNPPIAIDFGLDGGCASISSLEHDGNQDTDEAADVGLEDNQFYVEKLLRKRVRSVRKRKVVQYLVKWKGYPEEENTWTDEMDVNEDLVKEYKASSVSAT